MLPDPLFLNVRMYGIMIAVGILVCFLVLYRYSRRLSLPEKLMDFVFYDGVFAIVVGFGSAALFQAVLNYREHPEQGFQFGNGITFMGGLIGGAAAFLIVYFVYGLIYAARHKRAGAGRGEVMLDALTHRTGSLRLWDILPVIPCCITVAHAFGRIGCFFAGCCYGKQTDSFLGVVFPERASLGKVHPTQLYEAAFLFLLFGVLTYLLLVKKYKGTMAIYLIAYAVFRFLIEYLRGDDRGAFIGPFSPSQVWSIPMLLIGVVLLILPSVLRRRRGEAADRPAEDGQPG